MELHSNLNLSHRTSVPNVLGAHHTRFGRHSHGLIASVAAAPVDRDAPRRGGAVGQLLPAPRSAVQEARPRQHLGPLGASGSSNSTAAAVVPPSASEMLSRYTAAFNARDVEGVLSCMSHDVVHHGLAYAEKLSGQQAVRQFYQQLLPSLPAGVRLVQDDATLGGNSAAASIWHLELDGRPLPFGEGTTFVRTVVDGLISYIRESPEHFVKLSRAALPALGAAMPLFSTFAALSQGTDTLLSTSNANYTPASDRTTVSMTGEGQSFGGVSQQPTSSPARPSQSQQSKAAQLRAELESLQAEKAALELRMAGPRAEGVRTVRAADQLSSSQSAPPLQASLVGSEGCASVPGEPSSSAAIRKVEPLSSASSSISSRSTVLPSSADQDSGAGGQADSAGSSAFVAPAGYPFSASEDDSSIPGRQSNDRGSGLFGEEKSDTFGESTGQPLVELEASNVGDGPSITMLRLEDNSARGTAPEATALPMSGKVGLAHLAGVWIKDREASDLESYERALDLMRLGSIQKVTALNLIEGFELLEYQGGLKLKFLTVVPFFEVSETYRIDETTRMGRRDMKRGQQEARLTLKPDGMCLASKWGAPDPAALEETFSLQPDGALHVRSVLRSGTMVEDTLQVYRRAERWQPQNEWSAGSVLGVGNGWRNPFSRD